MIARRQGVLAGVLVLAGGTLAHVLDEEGLLPGVREAAAIREYGERAGRGWVLLAGFVLAVAVAYAATRVRGAAALFALVVGGQAAFFASYEVVARLHAGLDVAEVFAEPALATGFAVQCLIGAAFVALLLLAGRVLRHRAFSLPVVSYGRPGVPRPTSRAAHRRAGMLPPGRAPPSRMIPVPHA